MKALLKTPVILFAALTLLLAAGIWVAALSWTEASALNRLDQAATLVARQQTRLIDSELAKFRLLPIVLREYSDLHDVLADGSPSAMVRLNEKLKFLADEIGSPIIYVIRRDGTVIASSNANTSESFVGRNYGFRPYFKGALEAGAAEYYAIGDLSGRFGLFLAQRIGDEANPAGVVVIKFEFHRLVQTWANDPGQTFVVDPRGIILASTDKAENLRSFQPISEAEREKISLSGQFNLADLQPSHYALEPDNMIRGPSSVQFLTVSEPIAGTELKLLHIEAIAPGMRAAKDLARLITVSALLIFIILSGTVYWRITRTARLTADKMALETAVTERTAELSAEIAERERADKRFRKAREELAQANRLASLGSITAGLVHEINQPVATIQTLAENAQHHLSNGKLDKVTANLSTSIELTARIGSITQEMRRFARRGHREIGPVRLDELLEGTLLIIGDRLRSADVKLEMPNDIDFVVLANRVRLEQVLVNLLQNALDAVAQQSERRIALFVSEQNEQLSLIIADNGPGIAPEIGDDVFSPFVTGKPDGVGLGLGIARDIMTDLEGTLRIAPSPLGGAAFSVTIKQAITK